MKRQFYRTHVLCELIYSTGLYISEVVELCLTDVDLKRGVVKRGVKEYILNEYTRNVLQIYIEKMRPVILGDHLHTHRQERLFGCGDNSLPKAVNEVLKREWSSSGLSEGAAQPFTTKQLRHAMAFHLLRGGCDIRYIQEIIGHKNINNTQVYIQMDKEGLKSVIDNFHPRVLKEQKS